MPTSRHRVTFLPYTSRAFQAHTKASSPPTRVLITSTRYETTLIVSRKCLINADNINLSSTAIFPAIAMSVSPDLSLPAKAPTTSLQNESHNCDKVAVYTLVDLGINGIQGLLKALVHNDDKLQDAYRLPPKYDFKGTSLKAVCDYHHKLREDKSLHPTLFIVAQHPDYPKYGVLLVDLERVDTCRIKTSEALSAVMNLMIANMDWEDFKEDELPLPPSTRAGEKANTRTSNQAGSQRPGQSQPSSAPSHTFAVYTTAGADMTSIRALLEPNWRDKAPKTHLCESIASYTDSPDPWNQLIKHHPWNCRRNKRLHRQWFICADKKDPKEGGVLLVRIDWDGNIEMDPNELLKIGERADIRTERSVVENAIANLTALVSRGT